MRIFYSATCVDFGDRLSLVSLGLVRDDGQMYYAVNKALSAANVRADRRLRDTVAPHLPWRPTHPDRLNHQHADVKDPRRIAAEVSAFLSAAPDPELWSWDAARPHLLLDHLLGRFDAWPAGLPEWTTSLRQEVLRLGLGAQDRPAHGGRPHHALDDAEYYRLLADRVDIAAVAGVPEAVRVEGGVR
ncbi:hypothetical protein ACIRBX_24990 [Kitasatospora sp. NPDC096147]|uniref:hypothetical protein n=1 Tax=Kitasatospora sp. NPDC096147 TaxID=3364093 RepID=UPI003826E1CF